MLNRQCLKKILPPRPKDVHKKKLGHVLLVVGSRRMPGAGLLTIQGAFRTGIGGITAAYPKSIRTEYVKLVGEAFHLSLPETREGTLASSSFRLLQDEGKRAHAIGIGPGLGTHPQSDKVVLRVVRNFGVPMVIDASGLNAIGISGKVQPILLSRKSTTILTPHEGEMAKLAGMSSSAVHAQRRAVAEKFARRWNAIIVLKGYCTVIASPDGRTVINTTGCPGLATPGSGDVLTGIATTLLAQHPECAFESACVAAYVHGLAGDLAERELGERSVIASDVLRFLPKALTRAAR
ncbi:MAG: NAD(P)H-hydrate dehydratase [Patescibacteria group bacterium]